MQLSPTFQMRKMSLSSLSLMRKLSKTIWLNTSKLIRVTMEVQGIIDIFQVSKKRGLQTLIRSL